MKRLLFIGGNLYNYAKSIKECISSMGYDVDCIKVSHYDTLAKRMVKNIPYLPSYLENKQFIADINKLKSDYDTILIIRGDLLNNASIQYLKYKFSTSKLILYLWDSVLENQSVKSIIDEFDVVKSFDRKDCQKYGFEYLPLFYVSEYKQQSSTTFKYLFSFVGGDHSDRHFIIKELKAQAEKLGFQVKVHLRLSKLGYYKRRLWQNREVRKSDYRFYNLSATEIANIYKDSKCVLDIELSVQDGLTMRTFEVLASGKKLITTNRNIIDSDLYHPNNVCIIDRVKPTLDIDFINSEFVYNPAIERYSIENWARNLLSL